MNKTNRKFQKYMGEVDKTKQLQDDVSSSGSEGYNNWKKHRYEFSKYLRIQLKKPRSLEYESGSSSEWDDFVVTNEPQYGLKRSKARNLDK